MVDVGKADCVALAAIVCYVAAVVPSVPRLLSIAAGTLLCFGLAGVAVAAALLPGGSGLVARFVAVAAGVLAVGVVGGEVLNHYESGVTRPNWLQLGLVTVLVAYTAAWARGGDRPWHPKRATSRRPSANTVAKAMISALMLITAIALSMASRAGEEAFTEVWLLPDGPEHDPLGASSAVLGMKSHESTTQAFTVVVETGRQMERKRITLAPGQIWTHAVSVHGDKALATVYRDGDADDPYRTVWFVTR
ncbi:hypothetical protein [Mycobacterium sp. GA-2829]|uniref:hypothetical protein n=1 Tax=Mycobacterium sp. GA-2829 TaxID=1772283 RepID=UPI000740240D|nr:hypothetical protein [Mycobacterium sp. GA-2829]KUI36682.1 hypothetical protein AU194_22510 [Mycobacterium sp. GA-2829]